MDTLNDSQLDDSTEVDMQILYRQKPLKSMMLPFKKIIRSQKKLLDDKPLRSQRQVHKKNDQAAQQKLIESIEEKSEYDVLQLNHLINKHDQEVTKLKNVKEKIEEPEISFQKNSLRLTDTNMNFKLQKSLNEVNQDIRKIVDLQINDQIIRNLSSLTAIIDEAQRDAIIKEVEKEMKKNQLNSVDHQKNENQKDSVKVSIKENVACPQQISKFRQKTKRAEESPVHAENEKFHNMHQSFVKKTFKRLIPIQLPKLNDKQRFSKNNIYFTESNYDDQSFVSNESNTSEKLKNLPNGYKKYLSEQNLSTQIIKAGVPETPIKNQQYFNLDSVGAQTVSPNRSSTIKLIQSQLAEKDKSFQESEKQKAMLNHKFYEENKEFLQPYKQMIVSKLRGEKKQEKEETIQLQNSLGVLTLYQDLKIPVQVDDYQFKPHSYYAVPYKIFNNRSIFDTQMTQRDERAQQVGQAQTVVSSSKENCLYEFKTNHQTKQYLTRLDQ